MKIDFSGKKFIVFELTRIKQDRFLSNLVMSMIFTVIQKKLLSDRRKRGILIFDEYAETAQMVDTATGSGIHSSVAFCYQKIRKENGAVYTIVQTPDQLPDDENTKNIIGNTDMLFVLPTKEVIYRSIIDKFKLTQPGR
ncbi:type IV secretory system conjugative DNA transfer family protein [Bacteroides fragilis]|nr:type IV secretory system conjugative DNA transfer family protein [Bacteroides fragilis]